MKAVIFDMDGVLIDSEPLHIRLEKQIFTELGIQMSDTEHESFLGTGGYEMFTRIRDKFGLEESPENLVEDERRRYLEMLKTEGIPYMAGVPELVEKLHAAGVVLAVASSAPHEQINLVLDTPLSPGDPGTTLGQYIPVRVSGDDVEKSKPDPAIFLKAAELLGVSPRECRVIEDSENGVAAAISAGMSCLGFNSPGSPPQNLSRADAVIEEIGEAAAIILE
jgi:beta-phosphoglucomutase-like phosphatase (HAD superfamily)